MSAEHLERLTDRIYDAVVDPAQWRQVLADVAGLAGADEAMLLTADVVTGASDAIFHGKRGLGAAADFEAYYSAINPLVRMADPADYLARWRPTAIRNEDILARVKFESTEYYNDFLRPLGAEHGLYLPLDVAARSSPTSAWVATGGAAGLSATARPRSPPPIRTCAARWRCGGASAG